MSSSTREKVLQTLLTRPRITINDLAENVGINPISVRHHISSLQAEGLVDSEEERHGVGRPRRVYYLTEAGVEKFPTRYIRLTVRLLEQLKETLPPAMVTRLFSQIAKDLFTDHVPVADLDTLTLEERLVVMKDILRSEGFSIEWERTGDQYLIHETSCPYYHIGQDHPEVCSVDQIIISSVLSVPASKTKCILDGDNHCTYTIPANLTSENSK
jgi:DeoR family transcriptional regulator, suf operon transcriptional repressor